MTSASNILGIDIGSVSISAVEIDPKRNILNSAYCFHQGDIPQALNILSDFELSRISSVAVTTSTPANIKANKRYDNRICLISAVKHFHKDIGSILFVGGERFGLINFDKDGNYRNSRSNTSCAAGTGSFLDQQAERLNLRGIEEFCEISMANTNKIPKIASRCSVFSKTDIIHAQQEGYTLQEICDGLCQGLAKNITNTLLKNEQPNEPVIFTGGVSKNKAVAKHLNSIIKIDLKINDLSHLFGAIGAAFNLADENIDIDKIKICKPSDITESIKKKKKYYYNPLDLKISDYPDFSSVEKYEYIIKNNKNLNPIEIDLYEKLIQEKTYNVYLGIDIGSTSTKALLMTDDKVVIAGFYTRTAGRPLDALQGIFESIDDITTNKSVDFNIISTGTTGSGRKFIGKIINADIIIDEITAHARAAYDLNPMVDTIIEIGGQDSKFTTLKNGSVAFSIMNNVCAAGTGSFIEEQAKKLNCPLSEYSKRTLAQKAPLSSDRCTVFMERDLNQYLVNGYSVDEILASVLHSVRENYLMKVAAENLIGDNIFFQGATARNKSLVAAFEQRLKKPIMVSKYCHLTGALGTALTLKDEGVCTTKFRGIDIYKKNIPIRSEACNICTNHCKITVAEVDSISVAYGFLCGRDYDTKKFINNNNSGFDMFRERKKAFKFIRNDKPEKTFTIGIPAALHMHDDLQMWVKFFDLLSIKTMTSENCNDAIKEGKNLTNTEFCAPLTALYGHVKYLLDKADYIFLPYYLEKNKNPANGGRRQYCYYTQFAPSLISLINKEYEDKILMPLVKYLYNNFKTLFNLYSMLKKITGGSTSILDVSRAYKEAMDYRKSNLKKIKKIYKLESKKNQDISVVFIGRPYTTLSASMNNGIPSIFASKGIKTFYQDMLTLSNKDILPIKNILDNVPWLYGAEILKAAENIGKSRGIYPVMITSFKCTPDSFITDYFKRILERHNKPYLILQLDEHDSSVGYETRIEAAVRSFRNHHKSKLLGVPIKNKFIFPHIETNLTGKTLLYPNWDSMTNSLVVASLRRQGIDARLLEESQTSIQQSLKYNNGQCIPLNIITQEFINYIKKYNLDPSKTNLWMPKSAIPCNLSLFPFHAKNLLNTYGNGMEKAGVYSGPVTFTDISGSVSINAYFAFMFGGLLRKIACRIRPYEIIKGSTDKAIKCSIEILEKAFLGNYPMEKAVDQSVSYFEKIKTQHEDRPKVAIFGDLYVRDNDIMSQDLIRFIEENGGEVITTPYSHYIRMIVHQYFSKWNKEGKYREVLFAKLLLSLVKRLEKKYSKYFERILKDPMPKYDDNSEKILSDYKLIIEHTGESMENILKIFYIIKDYPDVSLFVQTNPAFCCPSLVTEGMCSEIERKTGVPIVTITYDGTIDNKNDVIIPYLKYASNRQKEAESLLKKAISK
ncbi:acyl-CoA dehydratase activase [Spirochaetota bacterium]